MKLNRNYTLRCVAGEYMLVNEGDTRVNMTEILSLSESAAWLWEKIGESEFDEYTLVGWLLDEYDVDEPTVVADVHGILDLWEQFGLLV